LGINAVRKAKASNSQIFQRILALCSRLTLAQERTTQRAGWEQITIDPL